MFRGTLTFQNLAHLASLLAQLLLLYACSLETSNDNAVNQKVEDTLLGTATLSLAGNKYSDASEVPPGIRATLIYNDLREGDYVIQFILNSTNTDEARGAQVRFSSTNEFVKLALGSNAITLMGGQSEVLWLQIKKDDAFPTLGQQDIPPVAVQLEVYGDAALCEAQRPEPLISDDFEPSRCVPCNGTCATCPAR